MDHRKAFDAVTTDPQYLANLDWGEARPGHPEGTVRAHIAEIEPNLERLRSKLTEDDYWKLKLLIHTHDSFKAESKAGVAITDPKSHASLARAFLEPIGERENEVNHPRDGEPNAERSKCSPRSDSRDRCRHNGSNGDAKRSDEREVGWIAKDS